MDEARKIIEQSFGNYVGSNVMIAAQEELAKIEKEIDFLTLEVTDAAIDEKSRKQMSAKAYKEIHALQEELRVHSLITAFHEPIGKISLCMFICYYLYLVICFFTALSFFYNLVKMLH